MGDTGKNCSVILVMDNEITIHQNESNLKSGQGIKCSDECERMFDGQTYFSS